MPLIDRQLTLLLLLAPACVPGSLTLGDEDDPASGDAASDDTGEPTGGPAQQAELEWVRKVAGVTGFDMAIAGDGSIIVLGGSGFIPYTDQGALGGDYENLWLGKFDPAGAPLWQVETPLSSDSQRRGVALAVTDDGVIHVAEADSTLGDGGDRVSRFAADGEPLGATALPGRPASIAAAAGGVIVGGSQATGPDTSVAWAAAIDCAGALTWAQTWGDPAMNWGDVEAIAVAGDEAVLAGALGVDPVDARSQAWVARVAVADGATIWDRTLGPSVTVDRVHDVEISGDGTIVALVWDGASTVRGLDAAGDELWSYAPIEVAYPQRMALAGDGSFVITDDLELAAEPLEVGCDGFASTCPGGTRVARVDADRSLRWSTVRHECRTGEVPALTADDAVVVLARCGDGSPNDVGLGLLRFAP